LGLMVMQILPADMPPAEYARGGQPTLV